MARAYTYTLLSLDEYARVMRINPLHFNGGMTPGLDPMVFPDTGCDSIWFQYDWQDNDKVSREQIAMEIAGAEAEVASIIGFPIAPMWVDSEVVKYPRNAMIGQRGNPQRAFRNPRTSLVGSTVVQGETYDVEGRPKVLKTQYGRFIEAGRRAVALVGSASVAGGELVYSDEDSDGFFETATITIALPASMADLTDACEFKTYFDGESEPEWEIRYPKSASISGGVLTLVFWSWLFIDPDLQEAFPTSDGSRAIDVTTTSNFVTTVDVYREYSDFTQASVQFYWDRGDPWACQSCTSCGGTGCEVCTYTTQTGCIIARDVNTGLVAPFPASYDEDNAIWTRDNYTNGCRPDMVKMWYKAGDQDRRYIAGKTCNPISLYWAQIIAWIATARLERPLCECTNLYANAEKLRQDLGAFSRANTTYFQTDDIINCPFGTLRGEVMAWRRIKKTFKGKLLSSAVI